MVSPSLLCLLAGAIPVFSAALKPLVAHDVRYVGEPERRHLDIGEFSNLEGRDKNLGTFNLAKTFPTNDVLIQVALGKSSGATSGSLSLTATCVDCHTTGSAVVTTSGVKTDDGMLGDIIDFIKSSDKTDLVAKALGMDLVVELDNFGGHFEFDISFAASGTYTVTLFKSETPVGVELDDSNKIGLLFTIELTLTVSDSVDFTTGFDLSFPKGASFTLNPINGDLVSMNIGGAQVNSIPVKFKKGAACIAAVLRLKFQAGVALKVFNTGFDFESGVFFDPLQYKACITYQPSQPCALQFTENFYEEIGAYARAVGDLDFAKLSVGPTAVSTFFTGALPSQCLSTASSSASSKTVISTTAPPVKQTSSAEAGTSSKAGTTTGKTVSGGKNSTATEPKPGSTSTKKVFTTSTAGSSANATRTGKTDGITASGKPSGTIISGGYVSKPTGVSTGVSKFGTGSAGNVYTQPTGAAPYGNSSAPSTQSFATVVTLPTSLQTSLPASSLKTDGVVTGGASTTDTITYTSVYTITSCKPEVTNCPARIGQVTSEVITTTTVCPVSGASSTAGVVSSPAVSSPAPTGTDLTTRTIFSTSTYTITSCLSNVLHCPASLTLDVVQTKTIVAYTTVCPVSQTDFPSALPSSAASSAAASQIATMGAAITTAAPSYSVNPVPLTPCETPIVKTFDSYAPLPTITMNITATAPYPFMNSTVRSFPTASGVASNSIVAPITKTVIPIPLLTGSASAVPVASASGSPIGYSKVNGYNGIKAQAETSGGVTLPSASPVSKQTSGAESVSPRGLVILGASVVGLFALL